MNTLGVLLALLLMSAASVADPIRDARDLTARAKTIELEASSALGQGDRAGWTKKSSESLAMLREAALLYRQAGIDKSDDVNLLAEYAQTLELSKDYDLAAEVYGRCAAIDPDNTRWHLKRGLSLVEVGPLQRLDAVRSLERALDLAPESAESAEAASALSQLYWDAGHYDLAEAFALRAHERNPEDVTAAINLTASLVRRGEVARAEKVLSSLRAFRGDELSQALAKIVQALSDLDWRQAWFEDQAENHIAYARLLVRAGRHADAALALKRAVQLSPRDTESMNLLGSLLQQSGDTAGARAAFERSLGVNPEQPAVRESLTRLE